MRAQEFGFTLHEITDLLSLNDGDCEEARVLAEHKKEVIQQRIRDMNSIRKELEILVKACRDNTDGQERCTIIETLAK